MAYSRARFDALTDGVFAVAMTLLVLDIHLPDNVSIGGAGDLWQAVLQLKPKAWAYGVSFFVLGFAWLSRIVDEDAPKSVGRREGVLGLAYLLFVTLVPFSTIVIGRYGNLAPAVWLYSGNLGLLGLLAAGMRLQIPPEDRNERHFARVTGSLLLAAGACLSAVLAAAGWGGESLLAFALGLLGPFVERASRRKASGA